MKRRRKLKSPKKNWTRKLTKLQPTAEIFLSVYGTSELSNRTMETLQRAILIMRSILQMIELQLQRLNDFANAAACIKIKKKKRGLADWRKRSRKLAQE